MGGNLFKEHTRRYTRTDYDALVVELIPKLEIMLGTHVTPTS